MFKIQPELNFCAIEEIYIKRYLFIGSFIMLILEEARVATWGLELEKNSGHTEQHLGFWCVSPSDYTSFLILLNVFFSKEEQN